VLLLHNTSTQVSPTPVTRTRGCHTLDDVLLACLDALVVVCAPRQAEVFEREGQAHCVEAQQLLPVDLCGKVFGQAGLACVCGRGWGWVGVWKGGVGGEVCGGGGGA
jgi:hypothetical protein